jgi:hypothetical protein
MKQGMRLASRVLVPLCSVAALVLACSSTNDAVSSWTVPEPPTGSVLPSGGAGAGGSPAAGTGGKGTAGSGGGGSNACTKTADCATNGFCKAMACTCPVDKPDQCQSGDNPKGACVDRKNDADNCGACGMKCDGGAACIEGKCGAVPIELAKSTGCGSIRMALGGTTLYFAESMSGKIKSIPVAGGVVTEIATGQTKPTQIVADAGGVYWIDEGAAATKILKKALPIAAGEPVVLKATTSATEKILAIAVGGDKIYYTLGHEVHQISTDAATKTDTVVGVAVNHDLEPPMPAGEPAGLVVNGNLVAWTTSGRQGVERDDITEGENGYQELGESQGNLLLQDLGMDAMYVYWANGENFVRAKNDVKGNASITHPPSFDPITAFAINAQNVYFAAKLGMILKHDLTPLAEDLQKPSVAVAREQPAATSVVLDATKVYWATSDCAIRSSAL